jgi:hypothetical protein
MRTDAIIADRTVTSKIGLAAFAAANDAEGASSPARNALIMLQSSIDAVSLVDVTYTSIQPSDHLLEEGRPVSELVRRAAVLRRNLLERADEAYMELGHQVDSAVQSVFYSGYLGLLGDIMFVDNFLKQQLHLEVDHNGGPEITLRQNADGAVVAVITAEDQQRFDEQVKQQFDEIRAEREARILGKAVLHPQHQLSGSGKFSIEMYRSRQGRLLISIDAGHNQNI